MLLYVSTSMIRSPFFYLILVYFLGVGIFVFFWWGRGGSPEAFESVAISEAETSVIKEEEELSPPERVRASAPIDVLEEPLVAEASDTLMAPSEELYPNEREVRSILQKLKDGLAAGDMSKVAYQAYLSDLEELIGENPERMADVWITIQSEFGQEYMASLGDSLKGQSIKADVERKFGFAWGQADPRQSLDFARQAGDHVLAGWLAGQIDAENDYLAMLDAERITPSPEVYWEALIDIAQTDTILSLDTIMANHMDQMDLDKWKEILFAPGNSDDAILAAWFQENIGLLATHENFDEVEIVRMLRRFDYGEGSFMLTSDLARVEAAKAAGDYVATARILEELSALYGDTIDASAAGRFVVNWSKQDFAAATDWLLGNADKFADQESFISMLGTSYRHEARRNSENPELAIQRSLLIQDEMYQAMAISNVVIPQMEKHGTDVPVEWVSNLPQGFVKQRSMAGYVLGLSRHTEETTLEAQVKFQFLQDEYDLPAIQQNVLDSDLSNEQKISVVNFFSTY